MPFSAYPPSGPFVPNSQAADLLTSKAFLSEFWEAEIGRQKAFYVRGTTWFKGMVVKEASRVYDNIERMQAHVRLMQGHDDAANDWGASGLRWDDEFSRVQVGCAWKKAPLAFDKAAKVVLLCAITAAIERETQPRIPAPEAVYGRMRIEPAIYFVHGLDAKMLAEIRASDEGFLQRLKRATGQKNVAVFADMAQGKTVTLSLAQGVQSMLRNSFPTRDIGDIDIPHGRRLNASLNEDVDRPGAIFPGAYDTFGGGD